MSQKLDILEGWYEGKIGNSYEKASVREIGELILFKGLANDIDSAIKVVYSQLKLSPTIEDSHKIGLEEFNRIFLVSLLK